MTNWEQLSVNTTHSRLSKAWRVFKKRSSTHRNGLILYLALMIIGDPRTACANEGDIRTEIKTHLARQAAELFELQAECLRLRASSAMLAIKTRELLQQRLDILAPECGDDGFELFARDVLSNSEEYSKPYAEIRLVHSRKQA